MLNRPPKHKPKMIEQSCDINYVTVAFNKEYIAVAYNLEKVMIYNIDTPPIIFQDTKYIKLYCKPEFVVERQFNIVNGIHIGDYKNNDRSYHQMKYDIINQGYNPDNMEKAHNIALIMMKYKLIVDSQTNESIFNNKRDCYLLYLTVYNEILAQDGPTEFMDLINKAKKYKYLCKIALTPVLALQTLIKIKALQEIETLVSIPDIL